jgi:hypothetical protein
MQHLIEELWEPDLEDEAFDVTFHRLMDTVAHHVATEENALFPFAAFERLASPHPLEGKGPFDSPAADPRQVG